MKNRAATIVSVFAVCCILATAGVADSAPPAPAPKPDAGAPPAAKPVAKPVPKPVGKPVTTIDPKLAAETAAAELIVAWTAAQNQGDFATYQTLYAKRLVGVRRSGPRVRRFDRKGWMADRERMFAKKMEVSVESPVVKYDPTLLRVAFIQKFAQGNFKDSGRKELDLTKEEGAWRITREEMMESTTEKAPPKASAAPASAYDFGFFVDGDMVLGKADMSWAKADLTHKGFANDVVELRAKANDKLLPPEIKAVLADKVRLVRVGGSCVGRLRSADLRGRVVPHFGSRATWKDLDERLLPEWIPDAWAQSDQQLVSIVDGCPEGGIFVRNPSLPEVSPVAPEKPAPGVLASARRAFSALPDYKSIAAEFKASGGKGSWSAGEVEVMKTPTAAGTVTLVWVSAREGVGCGGFYGELTALYKAGGKDGTGKLELLWSSNSYMRPVAAFDLDGDALPELLINTHLDGRDPKDGGALGHALCRDANCKEPAEEIVTPMNDCPC